jgi:hypothetical protein
MRHLHVIRSHSVIGQLDKKHREKYAVKSHVNSRRILLGVFFEKYARVQAINARVQAINAVHPGVDDVNCTVLSNGMCHTRAQ